MRRLLPLVLVPVLLGCNPGELPSLQQAQAESCDPADAYLEGDKTPALARLILPAGARFMVLPGVTLSSPVATRIHQLDDAFFRRTGKHLIVVSGTRDPGRQARAMIRVIELGGSLTKLYEDREAAAEIQKAYERARGARKRPEEVVAAVQSTLQAQIQRGVYISAHLRAGAVDIRSTIMTEADRKAFRAAVREVGNISLLEEHRPPHFHLEIERDKPEPPERRPAR